MPQDNNTFNLDGLNTKYARHTRKTGDKVTADAMKDDATLKDTFKYPNKDKSIYYKHPSIAQIFHVDLSQLTGQQVHDLCADTVIILQQKDERALSLEVMSKRTEVTVHAAELLNNKKAAASPEQNIEKNFGKMSPEAKKALLIKLSSEVA